MLMGTSLGLWQNDTGREKSKYFVQHFFFNILLTVHLNIFIS